MAHTLFISDLHLSDQRPLINQLFFSFLQRLAPQAEALYILGDLFDYWIGDDAMEGLSAVVATSLKSLSQRGVRIYFMAGNRDFLIGERFAQQAGLSILADPTLIQLYGQPLLLLHGDTLCVDDIDYQAARIMLRSPEWQKSFLAKPVAERRDFAQQARLQSSKAKAALHEDIMDASNAAIDAVFKQYRGSAMIHGHTHRPQQHWHTVDGRDCVRWVLPDWHEFAGGLKVDGFEITTFNYALPQN